MKKLKVHLGCWHRYIPEFVHVDLCDMPHIDYKSSIDRLPFLEDGSVELIYCSHALEYFDRKEAVQVLAEWRRVLRPGGRLRLAVPDFRALIKVYEMTGELDRVLGPLYGRMEVDTFRGGAVTLYHKTIYDEASLAELLRNNGFIDPKRWDWRETEHAEIDDHSQAYYPHMQKRSGLLISLNIEAVRAL
jgi:SAM-dependent methyltransferase